MPLPPTGLAPPSNQSPIVLTCEPFHHQVMKDITIKKLTHGNPTMKEKFAALEPEE